MHNRVLIPDQPESESEPERELQATKCVQCTYWEPMAQDPACEVGFCRRFALTPGFDAWPITQAKDSCEQWTAKGYYRREDGTLHTDRRTDARTYVNCPAKLQMIGGDRHGYLTDISEKGAGLNLSNPPSVGLTGLLVWDEHEYFCKVAWASEIACGVTFDMPLSRAVFLQSTNQMKLGRRAVANPVLIPFGKKRIK